MPSLDDLVAQHNPAKPLSLDEALAKQSPQEAPFQPTQQPPMTQGQAALAGAKFMGNQSIIPESQNPAALVRNFRGLIGRDQPYGFEANLPDPTFAGAVKGISELVTKPVSFLGHTIQLGQNGGIVPGDRTTSNLLDAPDRAVQQASANFNPSKSGEALGQIIPTVLTGGASAAPQVVSAVSRVRAILQGLKTVGGSTLAGAAIAPVMGSDSSAPSEADYWSKAKDLAVTGAKWGLGLGATATAVPALINAWAQKFKTPEAATLLDNLQANNVPMSASEIAAATKAPSPQLTAAETMVKRLNDQLKATMNDTPFAGLDEVRKAAAEGGKRSGAAQAILDEIAKNPKDAEAVLQTSGGLAALREKMRMDALAQARDTLAVGVKGPLTDAASAIDRRIEFLSKDLYNNPDVNKGEIAALQQLKQRFLGKPQADHLANPPEVPTFQQASATRSNIADEISKLYKGNNAVTGQADAATLQAIKEGLNSDISRMAENSGRPALTAADRLFRSEYSNFSGTFKDPTIVKAITSSDPSVVMAGLAKAGPEKAQRVFDAMDPKGQAAYASGIFKEAIKDATNPRTGDWIPGNVAMGLHKTENALGVTIKDPAIRGQLDSALNVLQALAKANPEQASALGQRVTGSIVEANEKTALIGKLYQAVKDHGMDLFFNTQAGKDFLFKAKGLPANSPTLDALIRQDAPKLIAIGASRGGQPIFNPSTVPLAAGQPAPLGAAYQFDKTEKP